jgi:hypothetical protein
MSTLEKGRKDIYYRVLFLSAAVYDTVLGIIFLFFYRPAYSLLDIPVPEYPAYLSLSAAFVLVIGIAYYIVYLNIHRNRDLVVVGTFYKLAYTIVVFYYFLLEHLPHNVFLIFGIIDMAFFFLFVEFLSHTKK